MNAPSVMFVSCPWCVAGIGREGADCFACNSTGEIACCDVCGEATSIHDDEWCASLTVARSERGPGPRLPAEEARGVAF